MIKRVLRKRNFYKLLGILKLQLEMIRRSFYGQNMKKIFVLLLIAIMYVCAHVSAQETLALNYLKYPPLSWEENGVMRGIMVDILNEAFQQRMGIKVSHHQHPWKRAQKLVEKGQADGFTTVPTPERREYTNISNETVIVVDITMFTWTGNPSTGDIQAVENISGLKGFHLVDYLGNGWAKRNLAGLDIYWAPKMDNALQMLAKRRADVFVQNSMVTHYNIRRLSLQNKIIEIPNSLSRVSFNLCIGKKSPYANIIPEFDETIATMREDGSLQTIYDRYK